MDMLTTNQAAEVLGISRARVHQLIKQGVLKAEKVGRDFQIRRDDLARAKLKRRTDPGRPKK